MIRKQVNLFQPYYKNEYQHFVCWNFKDGGEVPVVKYDEEKHIYKKTKEMEHVGYWEEHYFDKKPAINLIYETLLNWFNNNPEELEVVQFFVDILNSGEYEIEDHVILLVKKLLIEECKKYDSSKFVNSFTILGYELWLDSGMRRKIKDRLDNESTLGITETTLWNNGIPFNMTIEQGYAIYSALEKYASECYDNTQRHLAEIQKLETIDEIINYDYKSGYPDKLTF